MCFHLLPSLACLLFWSAKMHDFSNLRFHYLEYSTYSVIKVQDYSSSTCFCHSAFSLRFQVTCQGLSCCRVFVSVALDTLHYMLFFALVNTFLHRIINFFLTLILGLSRGFLSLVGKCSHKGIKSL